MTPYFAVCAARMRALLQYRAAALAGLGTQIFWGWIRVMIFSGFFAASPASQPMSLADTITYIWLGQALLLLVPWRPDGDVASLIRTGNVACELVRPVDLHNLWYARAIAIRVAPTLLRAVPMFVIAGLFFGLAPPATPAAGLAFAVSVVGAVFVSAAVTNVLNISLFWTLSGEGVARLLPALVIIFSGQVIPLPFFPDWMQPILNVLPFRAIMDTPFRLYIGHIGPEAVAGVIAHQVAWLVGLTVMNRALVARGLRRVVVQGG